MAKVAPARRLNGQRWPGQAPKTAKVPDWLTEWKEHARKVKAEKAAVATAGETRAPSEATTAAASPGTTDAPARVEIKESEQISSIRK